MTIDESKEILKRKIKNDYSSAINKLRTPNQLTTSEKFAVAITAGVKWHWGGEHGNVPTTEPCYITAENGKWIVYTGLGTLKK